MPEGTLIFILLCCKGTPLILQIRQESTELNYLPKLHSKKSITDLVVFTSLISLPG